MSTAGDKIEVTFEFEGKEIKGILSKVAGAGTTSMFHLNVDGYHWGQLFYVKGDPGFEGGLHAVEPGWRFYSNSRPELNKLADFFGNIVELWYE